MWAPLWLHVAHKGAWYGRAALRLSIKSKEDDKESELRECARTRDLSESPLFVSFVLISLCSVLSFWVINKVMSWMRVKYGSSRRPDCVAC